MEQVLDALITYRDFIDNAHIIEGQFHWLEGTEDAIKALEEALKQSKPLTDEEIRKFQHHVVSGAYQHSFIQGVRYAESAHGIKE